MKFTAVLAALFLVLCSCSSLSPDQKRVAAAVGSVSLNFAQAIANTAVQVVLAKAVSDQDLSNKGNYLDSAAAGLRTIETSTSGIVTPQLIANTILQFTNPDKNHWGQLADSVAAQVASSSLPPAQAIEQAATALNNVAASTRQP